MSPSCHPSDDTLLAFTTGAMPPGGGLVVRLHLERCLQCRKMMRFLEALGGAVLAGTPPEPVVMRGQAVTPAPAPIAEREISGDRRDAPVLETGGIHHAPWEFFLPGVVVAPVLGDFEPNETVRLLKGSAGALVPEHSHEKVERFIVLEGEFGLDSTVYKVGDYIEADAEVTHTPFIPTDCLCLFALEGGLVFTGAGEKTAPA